MTKVPKIKSALVQRLRQPPARLTFCLFTIVRVWRAHAKMPPKKEGSSLFDLLAHNHFVFVCVFREDATATHPHAHLQPAPSQKFWRWVLLYANCPILFRHNPHSLGTYITTVGGRSRSPSQRRYTLSELHMVVLILSMHLEQV